MKTMDMYSSILSEKEQAEILGREPTILSYKLIDYDYNKDSKPRILSGLRKLDYMLKGFELGCITLWSGSTNSGKTTMLTLLARETVRQGNKVFFFNGEQTKDDFKNNLYKASVTKDDIYAVQYKNTSIYDYYVKDKKLLELDAIYGPKIIVFNNNVKRDIDTLLLAMEQAYNEENVKCFILDNFMQIDIEGDNIFQEQTKVMEKLRTFAVNKEVHIHLVAHPRKIENYQTRLSLYDVSGSMNIPNKAYNIVSIIRKSTVVKDSTEYKRLKIDMFEEGYDFEKSDGVLEVLKTKGNRIGLIGLTFDKTLKTYVLQEEMNSLERAQIEQEIHALKSERKKCKF